MVSSSFDRHRFGQRLKKAISDAGMRNGELAAAMGLDPSRISEWTHARALPRVEQLPRLARELDTDLHWLITGRPAPTGPTDALVGEAVNALPTLTALAERARAVADVAHSD